MADREHGCQACWWWRRMRTRTMSNFAVPSGRFWMRSTYPAEDELLDMLAAAEPGTALLTA